MPDFLEERSVTTINVKNTGFIFLIIFMMLSVSGVLSAREISFNQEYMSGHTTYTIAGDDYGGWRSELAFPLNTSFIKFIYEGHTDSVKSGNYQISIARNQKQDVGIFTDSDWIYSYEEDKLIYSESKTRFKGWFIDNHFKSKPFYIYDNNNTKLNMMTGYKIQYLEYDIYHTFQYDYYNNKTDEFVGETLDYSIIFLVPYTGIEVNNNMRGFNLGFSMAYSPYLIVKDRDDHILREKISYINAYGKAFIGGTKISYFIHNNLTLFAEMKLRNFRAAGTQTQFNYEGEVLFANIDSEIVSNQQTLAAGITYKF